MVKNPFPSLPKCSLNHIIILKKEIFSERLLKELNQLVHLHLQQGLPMHPEDGEGGGEHYALTLQQVQVLED